MFVSILGKQRKGKKSFDLQSEDEFGFNIECYKKGKVVRLFNLTKIIWMNSGENVLLSPPATEMIEFTDFDKVVIKHAKHMEAKGIEILTTT